MLEICFFSNSTWLYFPNFLSILPDSSITGKFTRSKGVKNRFFNPCLWFLPLWVNLNREIYTIYWVLMYSSKSALNKYQSLLFEIVEITFIKMSLSPNIPSRIAWKTFWSEAGIYLSGLLVDILTLRLYIFSTLAPKIKIFYAPTSSKISTLAPSIVPMISPPFITNFMFDVPEAYVPAVEICSLISEAGIITSALETL